MNYNDKIIDLYEKSGLTKRAFAHKIGVTPAYITVLFSGKFILKPNTYKKYYDRFRAVPKGTN